MARHPAPTGFTDGVLVDDSREGLTDEEKDFLDFRDDSKENDYQPDLLIWKLAVDPRTGKPKSSDPGEYCTDVPMDSFQNYNAVLSWIRDTYGPGSYRITGRMRMKDGEEKIRFKRRVDIANFAKKPDEPDKSPGTDLAAAIKAMSDMLAASQERQDHNMRAMVSMLQRPAGEALTAEKVAQWATVAAAVLGQLRGLFAPPAPAAPMGSLLSQLQEFKAVQDLLGGNSSVEDNDATVMNTLIKTLGAPIAAMLMKGAMQPTAPAGAPQLPGPAMPPTGQIPPANRPTTSPAPEPAPGDPMTIFKTHIGTLIAQAKAGTPAKAVADFVLATRNEAECQQLLEVCEEPGILDKLVAIIPEAAPHRAWLDEFRAAIVAAYEEPGDGASNTPEFDNGEPGGNTPA